MSDIGRTFRVDANKWESVHSTTADCCEIWLTGKRRPIPVGRGVDLVSLPATQYYLHCSCMLEKFELQIITFID